MTVKIVTDSSADIPPSVIEELGITVVPIYVRFGDRIYRNGVDIQSDEFYSMLAFIPVHPATSQPNPEDFTSAYKKYCDTVDGIVSIHISSRISGTYNSATIAKKSLESRCPIEVIDSKFNSAGLGLVVMATARLAQSGASLAEVKEEFSSPKLGDIAGCIVTEGYVKRSNPIRVLRENVVIFEGELESLRRFKDNGHIDPDLFDVFVKQKVYARYAQRFLDPGQID